MKCAKNSSASMAIWESRADDYESDATCLAKAIREAFESANFEDAKVILERAMHDHKDYF